MARNWIKGTRAIRWRCFHLSWPLVGCLAFPISAHALANPAAVFCVEQGGKLKPKPNGRELCILPNGRAVEEWAYFRAHHKRAKPRK